MAKVIIPERFFFDEAVKEYSDYQSRLVAELLQNSLDAGATEIRFTFDENGYSCEDNGCGMSVDTLVAGMLTLGASIKTSNSAGAFGAAKKLVLFSHANYSIHTQDNLATGSVLDYELTKTDFRKGTKIQCKYFAGDDWDSMDYKVKSFLASSSIPAAVYVNGAEITSRLNFSQAKVKDYDWAKCSIVPGYGSVFVRKNGLLSFQRYVGNCKSNIYLDVIPPSKEIFTQNRDGMRSPYSEKLDALLSEIAVDSESFGKGAPRWIFYRGKQSFVSIVNHIKEKHVEVAQNIGLFNYTEDALATLSSYNKMRILEAIQHQDPKSKEIKIKVRQLYNDLLQADFVIDLGDSDYNEVPKGYSPQDMLKRHRAIAQTYRACLEFIAKELSYDLDFRVGFTFSKSSRAAYAREHEAFLINPEQKFSEDSKEKFYQIFLMACHEFAHFLSGEHHQERFVLKNHEIIEKLAYKMSWRDLTNRAKEISL